jgi:hypothetical protein
MLKERVTHEPVREVELRLSSPSAPTRMMKILEAEGGAEAACHTRVSGHQDPGANIITRCAGTKSHTYDESWHRIECHIFTT